MEANLEIIASNPVDVDSDKLNATVAKQAEWDLKFEHVEKKESALLKNQWSMMREQLRSLTADLAKAQLEIEALKRANLQATCMFKRELQDAESELDKERLDRSAEDFVLQRKIDNLRRDMSNQVKARAADTDKLKVSIKGKFESLEKSVTHNTIQLEGALKDLTKLKADVDLLIRRIDPLSQDVKEECEKRKALGDGLTSALKDLEGAVKNQMRDRDADVDARIRAVKNALDKEKVDRDTSDVQLGDVIRKLQHVVEPYSDELQALANKICELDSTVHPRLIEHKRALDKSDSDRIAGHTNLAQKIADLTKKVEAEVAARAALQDDMEQMLEVLRSRLRALIQEQVNLANARTDALGQGLTDELHQELADRAAGDSVLEEGFQALKKALNEKIQTALDNLKDLESKLRDELLDVERKGEASVTQTATELKKHTEILREAIVTFVSEQDATDESILTSEKSNLEELGKLFKDVGQRFLGQHTAPRRRVRAPNRRCKNILARLDFPTLPTPRDSTPEKRLTFSQNLALSPCTPGSLSEPFAILPALCAEQKSRLSAILDRDQVQLVLISPDGSQVEINDSCAEISHAQVKLNEPVDFKPVHHGKTPTAMYKDEEKALGLLGDVADVLRVFSTATVLIEGHTATPSDKVDEWAHEFAKNRAEKVQATIASHGIDPKRLKIKGCPGGLGEDHADIKINITDF